LAGGPVDGCFKRTQSLTDRAWAKLTDEYKEAHPWLERGHWLCIRHFSEATINVPGSKKRKARGSDTQAREDVDPFLQDAQTHAERRRSESTAERDDRLLRDARAHNERRRSGRRPLILEEIVEDDVEDDVEVANVDDIAHAAGQLSESDRKCLRKFRADMAKLEHKTCLICEERFPTILSNECKRCKNDKKMPKKFSHQNNMDPGMKCFS